MLSIPSSSSSSQLFNPLPQHFFTSSKLHYTSTKPQVIKMTQSTQSTQQGYDRAKEVKEFDDSKIGVKGLLDSGITSIPRIFHHPPENLRSLNTTTTREIATIDLSNPSKSITIDEIYQASSTLGFFQIINHGIPTEFLNRMIEKIKGFHELPTEVKSTYYNREMARGVSFSTNFDLLTSKAASWRDTLQVKLGPKPINPDLLPDICRSEVMEYNQYILGLGETLMGLLSQGLGVKENRLKEMSFVESRMMVGHYYPFCPQPDRTIGIGSHMDPAVLTILLQDQIGGLQVKDGDDWINVRPIEGALIINIGDILAMVSNGVYKSVEHRVLANAKKEPRISIAVFFNPGNTVEILGPLDELVSEEKPAIFKKFTFMEFAQRLFPTGMKGKTGGLDGKTLLDHFRV